MKGRKVPFEIQSTTKNTIKETQGEKLMHGIGNYKGYKKIRFLVKDQVFKSTKGQPEHAYM